MNLNELLDDNTHQDCSQEIKDIHNDSRLVKEGSLFLAYKGGALDGRHYIEDAVQKGACAVLYDDFEFPKQVSIPKTIPCVAVHDLASKLSHIAKKFYGGLSQNMSVTGVTGTNGKTTIAYQLAQAHTLLKQKSAYIGTIGQGAVNQLQDLTNTTPDALCLQKLLAQYVGEGMQRVCMEVSSHALSQGRVQDIAFEQAIYTNLSLDHLDYHQTMQAYAQAKASLFSFPSLKHAIINSDDEYHHMMVSSSKNTITYGLEKHADIRALSFVTNLDGTQIELDSPWGRCSMHVKGVGRFNMYNSLAIFTSLMCSNYPIEAVLAVMNQIHAAPGRLELVAKEPFVFVDYAHTPDALINVMSTLNELKNGALWVVFGCGGDRDKSKRKIMGKAACDYADKVVLTSDNPRTEDPRQIIADIEEGVSSRDKVVVYPNRAEAIEYALAEAKPNDTILIAGKGHESYQQIGMVKHPFSDKDVVRRLNNN